jgi:choline transport protein
MDLARIETSDAKTKEKAYPVHDSKDLSMEKAEPVVVGHVGHIDELPVKFSVWSLGALLVCLMATWEALSSVVAQALISGGAPCLFYN